MGIIVAVGVILALSVEFWTFGKMIWTGFSGNNQDEKHAKETIDNRFEFNKVKGKFQKLSLVPDTPEWHFYSVLELTNTSDSKKLMRFVSLKLKTGETISLNIDLTLAPNQARTLQFHRKVPSGSSPPKLKIMDTSSNKNRQKWIKLPKIPVQAEKNTNKP